MTRKWNGKKFADLVVSKTPEGRNDVPMFYSPPESVRKEDEKEKGVFLFCFLEEILFFKTIPPFLSRREGTLDCEL